MCPNKAMFTVKAGDRNPDGLKDTATGQSQGEEDESCITACPSPAPEQDDVLNVGSFT